MVKWNVIKWIKEAYTSSRTCDDGEGQCIVNALETQARTPVKCVHDEWNVSKWWGRTPIYQKVRVNDIQMKSIANKRAKATLRELQTRCYTKQWATSDIHVLSLEYGPQGSWPCNVGREKTKWKWTGGNDIEKEMKMWLTHHWSECLALWYLREGDLI